MHSTVEPAFPGNTVLTRSFLRCYLVRDNTYLADELFIALVEQIVDGKGERELLALVFR